MSDELFDCGPRVPLPTVAKGKTYCTPDLPGTGPEGETCGSCRYLAYQRNSEGRGRSHPKCYKMKHRWTHGAATDIRVRWPACSYWDTLLPDWWVRKEHGNSPEAFVVASDWWLARGEEEKAAIMRELGQRVKTERDVREQSEKTIEKFNVRNAEK